MICSGVLSEQLWFSFQPLMSAAHMEPSAVGLAYASASLCSAMGACIARRLLAAHREALAIAGADVLIGIGGILLSVAGHPAAIASCLWLTCCGFGMGWAAKSASINAHVPTSHRAVCLSPRSSCEFAVVGLFGVGSGLVFQHLGPQFVAMPAGLAACLLAPLLYGSLQRLKESCA